MNKYGFSLLFVLATMICKSHWCSAQENTPVRVIGAMKNVMWKGELSGTIDLDTISNKQHLYGIGPVEFLSGELMILDGRSYKSSVRGNDYMIVEETYHSKAPFFVYTHVSAWKEHVLPDTVRSMKELESYLAHLTRDTKAPFVFKLTGKIKEARIHVVNLPEGSKVESPDDAHQGQENYHLQNEEVDILGFFSTRHQSIFTHHDSFMHLHLITADRTKMGHLDSLKIGSEEIKLFLPDF